MYNKTIEFISIYISLYINYILYLYFVIYINYRISYRWASAMYLSWNNILYENCNNDISFAIPKPMKMNKIKKTHEKSHFGMKKVEQLSKWEF